MNYSNNAQTTLKTGISASSTSVVLADLTGGLFPSGDFLVSIEKYDSSNRVIKREVVKCTARVGDICTITRSQESCPQSWDATTQTSVAMSFDAGDVFTHNATAGTYQQMDASITGKLAKVGEKRTGLSANKVLTTDSSGNEIESTTLPDAVMSSIATSPIITNTVGNAGKYIQTVALGEAVSSATPVAMAVVGEIKYINTLGSLITGSAVNDGMRIQVPYGSKIRTVKNGSNSSSSSARIQLRDDTGALLTEQAVASGSNSADLNYTLTAGTIYRIVVNDSANFGNNRYYASVASVQATMPYVLSGTSGGTTDNTSAISFTEITLDFIGKAYKARANRATEPQFANFAGFVTGTKAIGDSVDLNANDGGVISGFSGLTTGKDIYLSNTAGVISTTQGTIPSRIGSSVSSTQVVLDSQRTIIKKGTTIGSISITKATAGNIYSNPAFFHGGLISWTFTSNYAYTTALSTLEFSVDCQNWTTLTTLTHSASGTLTEISGGMYQKGYFRCGCNPGGAFTLTTSLTITT